MSAIDIVCSQTLFGDWEISNASNFFNPKSFRQERVMTLKAEQGFITFEDCKSFIEEYLQPKESINIIKLN